MNNEKMVPVYVRFYDANDQKNPFDEAVIYFDLASLHCGLYLCPGSATVGVFGKDAELQRIISSAWDDLECTRIVSEANEDYGIEGVIEVCINFMNKIGEWTLEAALLCQSEKMTDCAEN